MYRSLTMTRDINIVAYSPFLQLPTPIEKKPTLTEWIERHLAYIKSNLNLKNPHLSHPHTRYMNEMERTKELV